MILDSLQQVCAVSVSQTNNWENIKEEGFYYLKKDNVIELRKYNIEQGYISDYLHFVDVNTFYISDFSSPQINIFVQQLKEEIKARYAKGHPKAVSFSQIKKNAKGKEKKGN